MEAGDSNTIGQVRVDIGRLEGMVSQALIDQSRRLQDNEDVAKSLRTDLTAVNNKVVENTTHIQEIRAKQNGSWTKTTSVGSLAVAVAALIWPAISNHN
jgi:hypothetical protein